MNATNLQHQIDKLINYLDAYTKSGSKIIVIHKNKSIELYTEGSAHPYRIKRNKPKPTAP